MSGGDHQLEVRSYRTVFELERRIYRIDRFRLNPAGVPLRGVVYFLGLALLMAITRNAPVIGWATGRLPWYAHYLGLPAGGATLLALVRVDGRPFHLALWSLCAGAMSRRLAGLRPRAGVDHIWRPPPVLVIPDGSDSRLRRFDFAGPGTVLVRASHRVKVGPRRNTGLRRAPDISLQATPAGRQEHGRVIRLRPGATLTVRAPMRRVS